MKIPKQLTGEVKRFIDEIVNRCEIKFRDEKQTIESSKYDTEGLLTAYDFYNQPFKPEMITEYFGIKMVEDTDFMWETDDNKIIEWGISENRANIMLYDKHWLLYPKTLSDFITFALSAGIILVWRK